jgi:predicted nucleic acid-binding protein
MKKVLVDSSIWITYFRDETAHLRLNELIANNQICTNNLILSELIPSLHAKKQQDLVTLMLELPNIELSINWELIINLQIKNLEKGINKVGIPDLIIVDTVSANNLILYSEDRHFTLIQKHFNFDLLA